MALKKELLSLAPKKNELTPIQKFRVESSISDKFKKEGLRVYFLLDGTNTIQKILEQTGIEEKKMLEILEFLTKNAVVDIRESLLMEALAPEEELKKLAVSAEKAGVMPVLRSASEKKIYDKFGMKGVEVYRLTSAVETPEEILHRLSISEEELSSILDFLIDEGLISFERKKEEKEEPAPIAEEEIAPLSPKPAVEEEKAQLEKTQPPAPAVPETKPVKAAEAVEAPPRPVCVPVKRNIGLFGKLKIEAELLKKYGQRGLHLYTLIDGKNTTVKLLKETRCGFQFIDEVLDFLYSQGAIDLRELTNDEIRDIYGEEGAAINGVYGRDGLIIYELIDKRATIKDIIIASGVPPKKGVEIFAFIHKILNVDIPFDSHAILKQLGVE